METTSVTIDIWDNTIEPDNPARKDVLNSYEALPRDGVPKADPGGLEASAVGDNAQATGLRSQAMGAGALANDEATMAVGNAARVRVCGGTAVGQGAQTLKYGGSALGQGAAVSELNGIAIGRKAMSRHVNAVVIGAEALSLDDDEILIVAGANVLRVRNDGVLLVNGSSPGGSMINSIQRGIITMLTGEITKTATITSVNTAKTELRFLGQTVGNSGSGAQIETNIYLRLTNATTITATRAYDAALTGIVSWELTEWT